MNSIYSILPILVFLASDLWVYWDSTKLTNRGEPPTLVLGALRISQPAVWLLMCLILWIVAFPLYLVTRTRTH